VVRGIEMADLNEIAKALRLFNEKAEKLKRLSFLEQIRHPDSGITISMQRVDEKSFNVKQERRGPAEEAIDAFVLTFRYFIQDNEMTSFRKMQKHYDDAPIDPSLQQKFTQLRKEVNEYLDGETNINSDGEILTRRKIMDTFVYGGLSHANEEKRRLWKTWMGNPFAAVMYENEFVVALSDIHVAIEMIRQMNEEALKRLPGPS
jgi:hypothetical protein